MPRGSILGDADETTVEPQEAPSGPQFYKVRLSHPTMNRKVVFRSVSESRARDFVQRRFPRGSEAYLESPDGTTEHYEHERAGENGADADQWGAFDPDSYVPVEANVPPGDSIWADREG